MKNVFPHVTKHAKTVVAHVKEHHKKYPEINRQKIRRREARMNNIIEDFSNKEWIAKLETTKGICPKCNNYVGIAHLELSQIPTSDFKTKGNKKSKGVKSVRNHKDTNKKRNIQKRRFSIC